MPVSTDHADVAHYGYHSFSQIGLPANAITDTQVATPSAGGGLGTDKQKHRYSKTYAQNGNTTNVADRRIIHVARFTGTLREFIVTPRVAATAGSTTVVDLLKNGTTILSVTITLDSTKAAYSINAGAFSSTAVVANDVFEVNVTITGGAPGSGVGAELRVDEAPL